MRNGIEVDGSNDVQDVISAAAISAQLKAQNVEPKLIISPSLNALLATRSDWEQQMIIRAARDRLSRSLRLLVAGRISNDQFEASTPEAKEDAAIVAFTDMAWLLYSDMMEHRLVGCHSIDPDTRREVLRWILFLDSDCEYCWPRMPLPGLSPLRRARSALTRWLNWPNGISPERAVAFLAAGDHNAWPFMSRAQAKRALKNPRRLAGKSGSSQQARVIQ